MGKERRQKKGRKEGRGVEKDDQGREIKKKVVRERKEEEKWKEWERAKWGREEGSNREKGRRKGSYR